MEAGDEGSEEVGRSWIGPWLHVHVSPDTRKERGRRVGGVAGMSSIRGRGTDSPISFPRARSASMAKCTIFAQGEPKAQEDGWVLMYSFTDPRARFATSCRKRQPQGRAMDLLGPPCALQTRCTSIVGRPSIAGGLRGRGSSSSRAEAAPPPSPRTSPITSERSLRLVPRCLGDPGCALPTAQSGSVCYQCLPGN